MKYSSIIRNTFYSIINSTHTCTACKWVTTTSSNFCELEIALESDIDTGISMSVLQCFFTIDYYTSFLPANTASPLIKILKEFTENKKESKYVRDIRTLLIINKRDSILSNAEQNTVHSEVQGISHTNR